MSKEIIRRVRFVYGVILSVVTVIAGICLIVQCLDIYRSGPYSRDVVATHFAPIAVPVYLCLALVVGGFILKFALPQESKTAKGRQSAMMLRNLHLRRDLAQGKQETIAAVCTQQRLRRRDTVISFLLLIVGSIIFLIYGCNPANFGNDITASMISAMWVLLPCLGIPFLWAVIAAYRGKVSIDREIELMKEVPAGTPSPIQGDRHAKFIRVLQTVCVVVGLVILVGGFIAGGTADVLTKAINICTECIGLG